MKSILSLFVVLTAVGFIHSGLALELLSVREPSAAVMSGANGDSAVPVLSPDGRYVLFSSGASDLVTNDNGWFSLDVFRHDRVNQTTTLISENRFQTGGGNGHSVGLGISTNGRYALFYSVADDLVSDDTNSLSDVFVRDTQAGTTMLVSGGLGGAAGNGASELAAMTPDGRWVAFVSTATNLVAGDTNKIPDVFVRDLQTQTTTLVSVGASNTTAGVGQPVISADGRWVAFLSSARNLVPGVSNISRGEIYLRDLTTSTTLWPSMNAIGLVRSNMSSTSVPVPMHPVLSADGRYVTFAAGWTNNAIAPPGGTTFGTVLMQFDAQTLTTTVIGTNGYPPAPYGDEVYGPETSPDGRFVVYAARVVNNGLSPYCTLRCWDRQTGTSVGVSVDLVGGIMTNSASVAPVISADGRYVTFLSDATNLVSNSISNGLHVYRRDLVANTTELVDADLSGVGSTEDLFSIIPTMSADGGLVAYSAPDGNLIASDDNHFEDVFVRDLTVATNELISARETALVPQTGNAATGPGLVAISADGHRVVYASLATDLIESDTNNFSDVFVWDRVGQSNVLVSVGVDGVPARGGPSIYPQISADGRYVLFVSGATNLIPTDTNGQYDIFRRDLQLGQTTCVSLTTNGVSLSAYEPQLVAMTSDAQRLAFSARTNSASATYPIFWRDLASGETRLVVANANGVKPPSLSATGNRVAFLDTSARVVVANVTTGAALYNSGTGMGSPALSPGGNRVLYQGSSTLYCYDLDSLTLLRSWASTVSIKTPTVWSPDNRYVTFVTATALVSSDTNTARDVYLCDLTTGTLNLLSASATGVAGLGGDSDGPSFSADGRFIAYRSEATNLWASAGLFVFDRITGSNRLVVARSAVPGLSWYSWPAINADGSAIAFKTVDAGLVTGDFNQTMDAFADSLSVLSTVDGDADGLPDWWLQQYFGHANGQANDLSRPGDDADGDGLTNHEEFLTGTNPTDAASALEAQLTLTGSNAVLSWPAQPGKNYRVQYCDDVAIGTWQNLTTAVQVAGGQGTVTVSRTNPTRVFRVRCEE